MLAGLGAGLAIFAVFLAGVVVGGHPESTGVSRLAEPVRSLLLGDSGTDLSSQVLSVLREDYYRDFDAAELEERSVEALLEGLDDPYTVYLTQAELEALRRHNQGAYVGVGIQVAARDDALVITQVYSDSPAEDGDIRAGDRIVGVDGAPVRGGDLDAALQRIRGPEGSQVTLAIAREDAPVRRVELRRSRIRIPPVEARTLTAGDDTPVGYLKLVRFTDGAADALARRARAQLDAGAQALTLDLRQDPGGLVSEALGVAGVFLPHGTPVVTTSGRGADTRTLRTSGAPAAPDVPLVVLVDRNSASASEIVAGALSDADRATLVGERTFGKALVQSTRPLRDGGALKFTSARYLTPDGFDLAERGLPPDVTAVDDPDTEPDEALDRALQLATDDDAAQAAPAP